MDVAEAVAQAWGTAAKELGIDVGTNGTLIDVGGTSHAYVVYVADFGRAKGTVCGVIDSETDNRDLPRVAKEQGYFCSILSSSYAQWDRDLFTATLDDWQWFGQGNPPAWYTGTPWTTP